MAEGLVLRGVTARAGDFELRADVAVPAGSVTAILGPSGGGKSTLLAAVAGFVPVTGQVLWNGAEITGLPPGQRPVSTLFQDNNLFGHLTVAQNIGLGIDPRLRLRPEDRARIEAVLARLGLEGMGGRKPAALSGGQQSRVALGRVLLADRPLVLLDEPFAALGPGLRQEMLDLAAGMLRDAGRTVLLVTHDPDDAARVAGQVLVVQDNRVTGPLPAREALDRDHGPLSGYLGGAVGQDPPYGRSGP